MHSGSPFRMVPERLVYTYPGRGGVGVNVGEQHVIQFRIVTTTPLPVSGGFTIVLERDNGGAIHGFNFERRGRNAGCTLNLFTQNCVFTEIGNTVQISMTVRLPFTPTTSTTFGFFHVRPEVIGFEIHFFREGIVHPRRYGYYTLDFRSASLSFLTHILISGESFLDQTRSALFGLNRFLALHT